MKKPYYVAVLGLAFAALSGTTHAHTHNSNNDLIYSKTLDEIVTHEHAERLVIWDRAISAEVFSSERVPRQVPDFQFTRSIKGVTPSLELALVNCNLRLHTLSEGTPDDQLNFPGADMKSGFAGFLESSSLDALEHSTDQRLPNQAPIVVGLSKVGYSIEHHQLHALVYAEVGLLIPNGPYGGEGFFYVRKDDGWKLEGHAYLWQGVANPFWRQ
jgi:hypothetical protein